MARQRSNGKKVVQELVERAEKAHELNTQQLRFTEDQGYSSLMRWRHDMSDCPAYGTEGRAQWMLENYHRFPIFAGMLRNEAAINANRRWRIDGGRTSVNRARQVINSWFVANDVYGYSQGMQGATIDYHISDMGAIIETARVDMGIGLYRVTLSVAGRVVVRDSNYRSMSRNKAYFSEVFNSADIRIISIEEIVPSPIEPLTGFLRVDPSMCQLTGKIDTPLRYRNQTWSQKDYWRFVSMVSPLERRHGMGVSTMTMAMDILNVLYAVHQHDLEKLIMRSPKGLLLLNGITQEQWVRATQEREKALDARSQEFYGALAVLASPVHSTTPTDAKLLALSQLPDGLDREALLTSSVYALSMLFGRDAAEFWPVSGGSFGRGTETRVQHRKAETKAGNELIRMFERALNDESYGLSRAVSMRFEERDDEGALTRAELANTWADYIAKLRSAGGDLETTITRDEARSILVEEGLLDPSLTPDEEEATATDIDSAEDRIMSDPKLSVYVGDLMVDRRSEMIVSYRSETERIRPVAYIDRGVLCHPYTMERLNRFSVPMTRKVERAVLYSDTESGVIITDDDVDIAIAQTKDRMRTDLMYGLLTNVPYSDDELDEFVGGE